MATRCVRNGLLVALACGTLAVTAAEPAAPRPAVAILHGTYDPNRHAAEHDGVLAGLGWTASKYALTDLERLLADLDRFDLVIANPLFNYGPDGRDLGLQGEVWRRFLERGGALVLTDCNYPVCVDWLQRIAPSCAVTTEPCTATQAATESTPPHPLHALPNLVAGRNSWQHLVLPAGGWETLTHCGDGQAAAAVQPLGTGLLLISSSWPLRSADLENLWTNLQVRRLGLAVTRFETAAPTLWERDASLGLRSLGKDAVTATLVQTLEPLQGPARRDTAVATLGPGGVAALHLAWSLTRADDGARARLDLDVAGQPLTLSAQTLALPPLLDVTLRQPAYRGILLASALPSELVLLVTTTPDTQPLADLTVAVQVCAAGGAVVAKLDRQAVTVGAAVLRVPLAGIAPDEYVVRTELRQGDAVAASVERTLSILPDRPATVTIDEEMALRVDGKPFFPLGMYHVGEAELPAMAVLGLNTVQGWGGDLERARRFLDTAHAQRLKVLLEMGGLVDQKVDTAAIAAHVQAFKDHPALLAWYVRDEPAAGQQAVVREAAELFHRLDRTHPTYVVSCSPGDFPAQAQLADIFAVDPYPLPGGPITMVAQWADAAWKATQGRRPVWLIPQAHDNTSYELPPPARGAKPPTREQERCMVYQSLVHGAKGIVWYTWDDGPNMGAKYHPALQDVIRELCTEIAALAPWLLSGTQRQFQAADGKVHGLVGATAAGRRLIVVNTASTAVSAEFQVVEAPPGQGFTPLAGGPEKAVRDGRLALELAPLDVQVFSF